jgi:hypothetical protein
MRSSDEKSHRGKAVPMLFIVLAISFAGLLIFTASSSITNMPVYVSMPTNPPPQFAAVLGNNTNFSISVPYAQAAQKHVTEEDIRQIKRAIPRSKTVARFYLPDSLTIESSTEAEVYFSRRRKHARISLVKTAGVWSVESLNQHGIYHYTTPPDFLDKLSSALPF